MFSCGPKAPDYYRTPASPSETKNEKNSSALPFHHRAPSAPQPRRRLASRRCLALLLLLLAVLGIRRAHVASIYTYQDPVILPPELYLEELSRTARLHFPEGRVRDAALENLASLSLFEPNASWSRTSADGLPSSAPPANAIPDSFFSSDKMAPPSGWSHMWSEHGFAPSFFSDADADRFVEEALGGSTVAEVYGTMPRRILQADVLRYLLLLVNGGTWSDMDTMPLAHRLNWTEGVEQLSVLRGGPPRPPQPVRVVVGIENELDQKPWWSPKRHQLMPLNIHRRMELVQWTLSAAPGHPILVDTLRRVLESHTLYLATLLRARRESFRDGFAWSSRPSPFSLALSSSSSPSLPPAPHTHAVPEPWNIDGRSWVWSAGRWRMQWDPTYIVEWTGPGAWTDAVLSYVHATEGVRMEDLSGIDRPVQVGDVVFLPRWGFGQGPKQEDDRGKVLHLFRGSWKAPPPASFNIPAGFEQ